MEENDEKEQSSENEEGMKEDVIAEPQGTEEAKGFFAKNGPTIFLIGLGLYLILLSIGVIAEIFDIQPILDWWIWSPPGK
jgi:hypothetical protein